MPTTGRHYSFGRQTSSRSEGDNQLYPNLTGMDIEMSNLEEDRVSPRLRTTLGSKLTLLYLNNSGVVAEMETHFRPSKFAISPHIL